MTMGQARRYLTDHNLRGSVAVLDRRGERRWHPIWLGCREIAGLHERKVAGCITSGAEARPYIHYPATTPERWAFVPNWRGRGCPGRLPGIVPDRRAIGLVLVEPTIKAGASPNKQWGQWQRLVDMAPEIPWGQIGTLETQYLRGVVPLPAHTFHDAAGLIAAADCCVLPEGGLHHAAAALFRRAIVLFGAYIPPTVTGYDCHANLWVDDPEAVGWRLPNERCADAWQKITPDLVLEILARRNCNWRAACGFRNVNAT